MDMPIKNRRSIQVYCGPGVNGAFDVFEPDMGVVTITGIAHALANQCRFNGQCTHFYSVAQHSLHVSRMMQEMGESGLVGLLHDASEAYLADIPNPLKVSGLFDTYLEIESKVQDAIYRKFGLEPDDPCMEALTQCDIRALATERRFLMQPPVLEIWKKLGEPDDSVKEMPSQPPINAERDFVRRYEELVADRSGVR